MEQKQRKGGGGIDINDDEDEIVGIDIVDPTEALKNAEAVIKQAEREIKIKKQQEKQRRNKRCACW